MRVTGAGFTPRAQLRVGDSGWLELSQYVDLRSVEFRLPALADLGAQVLRAAETALGTGGPDDAELSISFVPEGEIRALMRRSP